MFKGYFIANTSNVYVSTGLNLKVIRSVVFQVQSARDALVGLVSVPGQYTKQMYEVAFDSTFRVVIR